MTRAEMAAAICVTLDELEGCEPTATCVDEQLGAMDYFGSLDTETEPDPDIVHCTDEVDDYHRCLAASLVTSFACADDVATVPYGSTNCGASEATFMAAFFEASIDCRD